MGPTLLRPRAVLYLEMGQAAEGALPAQTGDGAWRNCCATTTNLGCVDTARNRELTPAVSQHHLQKCAVLHSE